METNETQPLVFEIERIISRRETKKGTEYQIKWKNYPDDQNTWEPLVNLIADKAEAAIVIFESQSEDTPPKDVTLFLMSLRRISSNEGDSNYNNDDDEVDSDENINQVEEDWVDHFGSLPRDSIKRIIKLERNQTNRELYAQVEWNIRGLTGIKPPDSLIKASKLKQHCLRFYLDFLEEIMYTDKPLKI